MDQEKRSAWKDRMRQRAKEKSSGGKFKLAEGENVIRILPNAEGLDEPPLFEYLVHRDVGPNKRLVRCGKDVFGQGKCWLCDVMIPKLEESGNRAKRAVAEAIVAKEATVAFVATVNAKTGDFDGPLVWYIPTGGSNSLGTRLMTQLSRDGRDYEHPKKGRNFTITRTGTGPRDTRYGPLEPDDEPSAVPAHILAKIKPFSDVIGEYSVADQKKTFFGADPDEEEERSTRRKLDEDDDEDATPTKAKSKKASAFDDDDDEGDAPVKKVSRFEDEDEDEDEDAPKSKKAPALDDDDDDDLPRGKSKPEEDDDEDSPFEDDDELDDPPVNTPLPAPGKKRSKVAEPEVESEREATKTAPVKKIVKRR